MKRLAAALAIAALLGTPATATAGPLRASVAVTIGVDRDSDGVLSWDDTARLVATVPASIVWYDVQVTCTVGGSMMYSAAGVFGTGSTRDYRLDSQAWVDGTGADCIAFIHYLERGRLRDAGITAFTVAP